MTVAIDSQTIRQARDDPAVFAEVLTGDPLWEHQLEVVRSKARIRALCSGRRSGKTRTMAVLALHTAFVRPEARVLICSAGEDSAKLTLEENAGLLQSPLLRGSAADESKTEIVLSNGSQIKSVPASQKQIRGRGADLLVLDESCWIDESIWSAAKYTIVSNPGSRVLMASTPYGGQDGWFAIAYRAGRELPGQPRVPGYESFQWPSTLSPMVDRELLELWRQTSTDREWQAEVLAEWPDDAGAWFTAAELEEAIADYQLCPPADARRQRALAAVDWSAGIGRDSHALVLLAVLADAGLNDERHPGRAVFFIPWLEESNKVGILDWSRKVVEVGDWKRDRYRLPLMLSEVTGVGVGGSESIWTHQANRCTLLKCRQALPSPLISNILDLAALHRSPASSATASGASASSRLGTAAVRAVAAVSRIRRGARAAGPSASAAAAPTGSGWSTASATQLGFRTTTPAPGQAGADGRGARRPSALRRLGF